LIAALLIALAALSQFLLPKLAADRVRSQLASHGHVATVHVSAFPALKLLWGDADSVSIKMSDLATSTGEGGRLLSRAKGTSKLELSIDRLSVGPLMLTGVHAEKHGAQLTGTAALSQQGLRAALPPGFDVQPIASGGGELLLRASASLFGVGLSANAVVEAQDGALVVQPVGVPFAGLVKLTVFSDPRVIVEGISAQPGPEGAYQLSATARLH